ncbi:MAG: NAD(P) transhydrogenase subunit alpha [Bacteroidetes bacterium]|uniref:proton-translocating NAD(P)(+) transhydrogenase n=1 Tax=Phaeocystidibacter marisrubri TaxID=1577780 RepID=A0A6L3ZFF5_9FLAO|nr:NAD(P) transhydrogenase subunit alpha [Phaeocystidibacter marisrubri]KAB2815629.1 NAD(P) transhydrogenase subunit alpha [Phaeocystidibacter marisrubri]TNE28022.1 MAG: NAD(P) transhydrogenase subunit alpha [Bacteroidota bacterium]GGH64884.1 hypothetical protein GCM10011318_01340 [Phaeocystidibacter marisrubri]
MEYFIEHIELFYFLILAVFLGVEVISNVPAVLHTPLMSGANAISGIVVIGAIHVLLSLPNENYVGLILAGIAVFVGTLNISGGFFVTSRMLLLFAKDKKQRS